MITERITANFDGPDAIGWPLRPARLIAWIETRIRSATRRALLPWSSFVLIVALPTLIVAAYFGAVAADQYVAETKLAVRERAASGAGPLAKIVGFATLSDTGRDAYVVASYLRSRNVVKRLDREGHLRTIFSRPEADSYARFDVSMPDEELWKYWRDMVSVSVDSLSGILTIRARAFRPADALWICDELTKLADEVVDEIGARSRANTLRAAENEKQRAAERFVRATVALRKFRDSHGMIDPVETALEQLKSIFSATLERTGAVVAKSLMTSEAPREKPAIDILDARIGALDEQIAGLNGLLTGSDSNSRVASATISDYAELELEQSLGEKQYALAVRILEHSRENIESKMTFIATFVPPTLPRDASMPRRFLDTLAVFTSALILWSMIRVAMAVIVRENE
jgi:capsular polysaccharide transport system permease protein